MHARSLLASKALVCMAVTARMDVFRKDMTHMIAGLVRVHNAIAAMFCTGSMEAALGKELLGMVMRVLVRLVARGHRENCAEAVQQGVFGLALTGIKTDGYTDVDVGSSGVPNEYLEMSVSCLTYLFALPIACWSWEQRWPQLASVVWKLKAFFGATCSELTVYRAICFIGSMCQYDVARQALVGLGFRDLLVEAVARYCREADADADAGADGGADAGADADADADRVAGGVAGADAGADADADRVAGGGVGDAGGADGVAGRVVGDAGVSRNAPPAKLSVHMKHAVQVALLAL